MRAQEQEPPGWESGNKASAFLRLLLGCRSLNTSHPLPGEGAREAKALTPFGAPNLVEARSEGSGGIRRRRLFRAGWRATFRIDSYGARR